MSDSLETLLTQQLSEGDFHSSAAFSLDSVKARQKLSQHQLNEGYWLAKVVQAATRAGAEQVSFRFGKRQVQADFPCSVSLQSRQILELVHGGEMPSDPLLSHLVTAIRSSARNLTEWVEWSVLGPEGGERVRMDPHGVTVSALAPGPPCFELRVGLPSRTRSLSQTLSSRISELLRSTVEENLCLRQRCWMAPLKIYCDGRLLASGLDNRLLWWQEGGLGKWLSQRGSEGGPSCLMALRPLQLSHRTPLKILLPQPSRFHKLKDGISLNRYSFLYGSFALFGDLGQTCQGYLAVVAQRTLSLEVDFMLDGVMVDRYIYPLESSTSFSHRLSGLYIRAGIRVWVAVQPDELDLSQFKVRDGEEQARRLLHDLSPVIADTLAKVEQNLGSFNFLWVDESYAKVLFGFTAATGGVALLTGVPQAAAWVVLGLGSMPLNFTMSRKLIGYALEELRESLNAPLIGEGQH